MLHHFVWSWYFTHCFVNKLLIMTIYFTKIFSKLVKELKVRWLIGEQESLNSCESRRERIEFRRYPRQNLTFRIYRNSSNARDSLQLAYEEVWLAIQLLQENHPSLSLFEGRTLPMLCVSARGRTGEWEYRKTKERKKKANGNRGTVADKNTGNRECARAADDPAR